MAIWCVYRIVYFDDCFGVIPMRNGYAGTQGLCLHTLDSVYNQIHNPSDKAWLGFLISNKKRSWEEYKKRHCSEFEKLLAELYEEHPEEMEEARLWFKMALSEAK